MKGYDMKVLVQLRPFVDGIRMNGRKAWIGKDKDNKLNVMSIYTTKDTADVLNEPDLIELSLLESNGALKILDIYKR